MSDRAWWGTVRYAGEQASLRVALIASYRRGCSHLAGYPQMSSSSGPKDYLKNEIHALLMSPGIDEVYLVRGRGPMFVLVRKGRNLFDMGGQQVALDQSNL